MTWLSYVIMAWKVDTRLKTLCFSVNYPPFSVDAPDQPHKREMESD